MFYSDFDNLILRNCLPFEHSGTTASENCKCLLVISLPNREGPQTTSNDFHNVRLSRNIFAIELMKWLQDHRHICIVSLLTSSWNKHNMICTIPINQMPEVAAIATEELIKGPAAWSTLNNHRSTSQIAISGSPYIHLSSSYGIERTDKNIRNRSQNKEWMTYASISAAVLNSVQYFTRASSTLSWNLSIIRVGDWTCCQCCLQRMRKWSRW